MPASRENHGDDGDDLDQHFELAEFARLDGKTFGRCNRAQSADQELAADDDYRHPRRHERGIELNERDEGRGDEQFVGQGIEEHPHRRDLAALAREVAINSVGD